jgi:rRNA-processing protein FCF1
LSLYKQKISIEHKYRGSVVLPDNSEAKEIFFRTKQFYANHEKMSVSILFSKAKLQKLKRYQKGASEVELENLELYIEMSKILNFNADDAIKLQNSILFTNDRAHTSFNITKRLKLINKKNKSKTTMNYLFWDIENFSSISSIFNDIIEKYDVSDDKIFLAANPDSLYLKRAEWEANLYDYGKTLNSFNFIKCDHGKNVADDVLLSEFENAKLKNANVFILTFDRELKERFTEITDPSNNLYIMVN